MRWPSSPGWITLASLISACWSSSGVPDDAPTSDRPMADLTLPDISPVDDRSAQSSDVADAGADVPADLLTCERQGYDASYCTGSVACVPNRYDPTCSRATTCSCNMEDPLEYMSFDSVLCAGANLAICRAAAMCTPGHNRCSPNLPDGVEYAPVVAFEPNGGHGGLRILLPDTRPRTGWWTPDCSNPDGCTKHFRGVSDIIYSNRGFLWLCSSLGSKEMPVEFANHRFCAECSGATCYWNRGPLRERGPSVEISIMRDGCGLEVRYYAPGSEAPVDTVEYGWVGSPCW